jgi:hypothetical protein
MLSPPKDSLSSGSDFEPLILNFISQFIINISSREDMFHTYILFRLIPLSSRLHFMPRNAKTVMSLSSSFTPVKKELTVANFHHLHHLLPLPPQKRKTARRGGGKKAKGEEGIRKENLPPRTDLTVPNQNDLPRRISLPLETRQQ